MRPDIKFHLVESDGKKCEFLKNVSHETSAKVTIHNERAEKILPDISADVITARAFAPLVKILKITEPAAQKNPDLSMLLLKGRGAAEEESAAREIYTFDAQYTPSRTEEGAQILAIANLHKKNPS
jgi:16S rRNA (guanine527-N7)-methyltransferase